MKTITTQTFTKVLTALALLASVESYATTSRSVRITGAVADPETAEILVGVNHSGCGTVDFRLEITECAESDPVQCKAKLVAEQYPGQCQQELEYVTRISAQSAGLTDSYYSSGSLTIVSGKSSHGIRLPISWGEDIGCPDEDKSRCETRKLPRK